MPPTCCHTQHKGMTERFRKMSVKEEPCQPFRGSERAPRPANFGLVPLVPPFQRGVRRGSPFPVQESGLKANRNEELPLHLL